VKDYHSRVKRLEQKTGSAQERIYMFICWGYRQLEDYFKKGRACYRKGAFKGAIDIWEKRGKDTKYIDSGSLEGIEILENHGYATVTAVDLDERLTALRERSAGMPAVGANP